MPEQGERSLAYRPYRRHPVRSLPAGRENWTVREGILVRLQESDSGPAGFGEVAPIQHFGTESVQEALDFLSRAPTHVNAQALAELIRSAPPATAFALWSAAQAAGELSPAPSVRSVGLVTPADDAARKIGHLVRAGVRTVKIKVGLTSHLEEWSWLERLLEELPETIQLRLDPNQSWNLEQWAFWSGRLEALAQRIEFIEEPFPPGMDSQELISRAKMSPVPLALDESLARGGLIHWLGRDWPGYWVLKPSLCGSPEGWLPQLAARGGRVVLSSAFETGIGLSAVIRLADRFPETEHGLGTQSWFSDDLRVPENNGWIRALSPGEQRRLWNTLPIS